MNEEEEVSKSRGRLSELLGKIVSDEKKGLPPKNEDLKEFIDVAERLLQEFPEEFAKVRPAMEQVRAYIETHPED